MERICDEDMNEDALNAAMDGDLVLLKSIIQKDPLKVHQRDDDGYFPIHRASYNGHVEVIEYLLDMGANIEATTNDMWHPLHSAVNWNEIGSIQILLTRGADVNALTQSGQTAAHIAAKSTNSCKESMQQIIEMLMSEDNLDLTLKNSLGETAIDLAIRYSEFHKYYTYRNDNKNKKNQENKEITLEKKTQETLLQEESIVNNIINKVASVQIQGNVAD